MATAKFEKIIANAKNIIDWAISNQAPKLFNMEKAQRLSLLWGVRFFIKVCIFNRFCLTL